MDSRCVRCGKPISDAEADDNGGRCEICALDEAQPESYTAMEQYAFMASSVRVVDRFAIQAAAI